MLISCWLYQLIIFWGFGSNCSTVSYSVIIGGGDSWTNCKFICTIRKLFLGDRTNNFSPNSKWWLWWTWNQYRSRLIDEKWKIFEICIGFRTPDFSIERLTLLPERHTKFSIKRSALWNLDAHIPTSGTVHEEWRTSAYNNW